MHEKRKKRRTRRRGISYDRALLVLPLNVLLRVSLPGSILATYHILYITIDRRYAPQTRTIHAMPIHDSYSASCAVPQERNNVVDTASNISLTTTCHALRFTLTAFVFSALGRVRLWQFCANEIDRVVHQAHFKQWALLCYKEERRSKKALHGTPEQLPELQKTKEARIIYDASHGSQRRYHTPPWFLAAASFTWPPAGARTSGELGLLALGECELSIDGVEKTG